MSRRASLVRPKQEMRKARGKKSSACSGRRRSPWTISPASAAVRSGTSGSLLQELEIEGRIERQGGDRVALIG